MTKAELIQLNHDQKKLIRELKVKLRSASMSHKIAKKKIEQITAGYLITERSIHKPLPQDARKRRFYVIRKAMKLTQREMGRLCGISHWYVNNIENGPTPCDSRVREMSDTLSMLAESRLKTYNKYQLHVKRIARKGNINLPIPDDPKLRLKILSLYFGSQALSVGEIAKKLAVREEVVSYHMDTVE